MRYGFVDEAHSVMRGLVEASPWFGDLLPELFSGIDRRTLNFPVSYPTSCSPQAWAAAAPFLLLRTLLRFDPSAGDGKVWCAPEVPARMLPLRVEGLRIAGATVSVEVERRGWRIDGLPPDLDLVRRPRAARPALR
jgi:glycogen debranching enzyme